MPRENSGIVLATFKRAARTSRRREHATRGFRFASNARQYAFARVGSGDQTRAAIDAPGERSRAGGRFARDGAHPVFQSARISVGSIQFSDQ